ncbi:MAG: hypothetical protein GSR85_10620 [Desulfurococcales archaeon]|nr:hypothetical protein [Desulfurococcales archaeon]
MAKARSKVRSRVVNYALIIIAVLLILYGLYGVIGVRINVEPVTAMSDVAIIDGLSQDYPNSTLIETLVGLFESKGYTVTVYNSSSLTVDLLGKVLCSNYSIVVMRIHGGRVFDERGKDTGLVALFTSEPYNETGYKNLQARGLVGRGRPALNPEKEVFVVTPLYVKSLECSTTPKIVIVASCYSMNSTSMAEALTSKGVKVYIGWDDLVQADINDYALERVVRELLNGSTISKAVGSTYNLTQLSKMLYYPIAAGSYTLQELLGGK